MVLGLEDRYGIPPLATIVILGAETSFGDLTGMGGPLAENCNYGGIKASVQGPWSETASGIITIRGMQWWTWPTPEKGMDAWGLYLSTRFNGKYLELLKADLWEQFAGIYYGANVIGYQGYADDLKKRAINIRSKAERAGYLW